MADELALRGIIHDLSNALTVILGWAEGGAVRTDAERVRALRVIERNARAAHAMARRAIGVEIDSDVQTLDAICEVLRESLQVALAKADLTLVIELGDALDVEVPDPDDFEQVLRNLLLNALAFAPQGTRVHVRAQREGNQVVVRVSDIGPGIPQAMWPKLFEGHSAREGGAGLGLPHSRRTALARGGDLQHEPSERGTVFALRWGCDASDAVSSRRLAGRVVLVEDDDAVAELVTLALDARGAEVLRARTPEELALCVQDRCQMAVLDWSPIAAEPERWRQVLRTQAPHVKVLVVTGQPERVRFDGADVLTKPFEVRQLLARLFESM